MRFLQQARLCMVYAGFYMLACRVSIKPTERSGVSITNIEKTVHFECLRSKNQAKQKGVTTP